MQLARRACLAALRSCTKAIIAQRMLALQVAANGSSLVRVDGFQHRAEIQRGAPIVGSDRRIARVFKCFVVFVAGDGPPDSAY